MFSTGWIILFNLFFACTNRHIVQYLDIKMPLFYAVRTALSSVVLYQTYKLPSQHIVYILKHRRLIEIVLINATLYSLSIILISYEPEQAAICFAMYATQKHFMNDYFKTKHINRIKVLGVALSITGLVVLSSDWIMSAVFIVVALPLHILSAYLKSKINFQAYQGHTLSIYVLGNALASVFMFLFCAYLQYIPTQHHQTINMLFIMPLVSLITAGYSFTFTYVFTYSHLGPSSKMYPWYFLFQIHNAYILNVFRSIFITQNFNDLITSDTFCASCTLFFMGNVLCCR